MQRQKKARARERASVIYFTLRIWSHVIYIVVFPLSHWNAAGLFVILNCHRRTCVAFVLYTILCVRLNCVALSLCARCVVGKLQKLHGNQSDNQYSQLTTKRTHQNITTTAALHIEYLLSYTVFVFFLFFSSLFVAPFGLMLCIPWMCYDNKTLCSCLPLSIAFNSAQIQCAQQKRTRAIW